MASSDVPSSEPDRFPEPRLVVVCGLPGTGKTTVSGAVADRLGADRLRTDVVRKDLWPDPEYTSAETDVVYAELLDRARERLDASTNVVLDGTYRCRRRRDHARALANEVGAEFDLVKVECEEAVVEERIAAREDDASDADFEIYRSIKGEFQPVQSSVITVDNSRSLDRTRDQVPTAFPRAVAVPSD